ncbi:hypothetical protein N0V88_002962 [Collariella sp. IMI 366227]|nr:hypothetical protein N0V88_002962 [Collariella sp. IMI 366227]
MPAKRARDDDAAPNAGGSPAPEDRKPKKAKQGFRVGPDNLPDGAWKRKVTKIKKDLITKAKVKKQYAKVKAEHQKHALPPQAIPEETTSSTTITAESTHQETDDQPDPATGIHPSRQAMLDNSSRPRPPKQQPDSMTAAPSAEGDNQSPPQPQPDHRQRHSAMDKAKTPGRDGKVKVGRESKLLLERVQRMMGVLSIGVEGLWME